MKELIIKKNCWTDRAHFLASIPQISYVEGVVLFGKGSNKNIEIKDNYNLRESESKNTLPSKSDEKFGEKIQTSNKIKIFNQQNNKISWFKNKYNNNSISSNQLNIDKRKSNNNSYHFLNNFKQILNYNLNKAKTNYSEKDFTNMYE